MLISIRLLVAMAIGTAIVGAYLWLKPRKSLKSSAKQVGMLDKAG